MELHNLLHLLGYAESPNYVSVDDRHPPSVASAFRAASKAGALGAYVIHSSENDKVLPFRAAILVAKAPTPDAAREIHRKLWNLGTVPFLIVLLPAQIRVYTGFDFDSTDEKTGLIKQVELMGTLLTSAEDLISEQLKDFNAFSIDTGNVWRAQANNLNPERRVDKRLLRSLKDLETTLIEGHLHSAGTESVKIAHALIGKYVYIRYLRDREILSDEWLAQKNIDLGKVLDRAATLSELDKLVEALQKRFNGTIFPYPFGAKSYLTDKIVSLVAGAFKGDEAGQYHLNFEAYDFSFIPVELLSSIYEQFLHAQGEGHSVGAYYTPEPLADYLLNELNSVKPLQKGMRILDPCCGSGIFLVLSYRKLIEIELAESSNGKLAPEELAGLLENIYGVERNLEACYVTEFSLILTLLNYLTPPDLHQNENFQFPDLHEKQIFERDFFSDDALFADWFRKGFDWIIGNPPWLEIKHDTELEAPALAWISKHHHRFPVARNRTSEAFSWRVTEFLAIGGCVGLLVHAKSLHNNRSERFRKSFFSANCVVRITNFSNMRHVLFGGRAHAPAATFVFSKAVKGESKSIITHYGPFAASQLPTRAWTEIGKRNPWALTINENEVKSIEHAEAELGEASLWKLALWGNHRDKRAFQQLRRIFTGSLKQLKKERGWHLSEGIQLRTSRIGLVSQGKIEPLPEVKGMKRLNQDVLKASDRRFVVPQNALKKIPDEDCFVRKRGGRKGLLLKDAPHLVLNANYALFSNQPFVITSGQVGLSAPGDSDYLRAISTLCGSSVVQYYLFIVSPQLGIDRGRITLAAFEQLPLPLLTTQHVKALADLHKELAKAEISASLSKSELQLKLDRAVQRILEIPVDLTYIAREFLQIKATLDQGNVKGPAMRQPSKSELHAYAQCLRDELDDFTDGVGVGHKVTLIQSSDLTLCQVELVNTSKAVPVDIEKASGANAAALASLEELRDRQFSQWVYMRSGLRLFTGNSEVQICKSSRLIDWTRTEALIDSDDIIAEAIELRAGMEIH